MPEDLIILSAKFKRITGDKNLINEKIKKYIKEKKRSQPSQIKTCGSIFKNPQDNKAWKLIKNSNCDSNFHLEKQEYQKSIVTFL